MSIEILLLPMAVAAVSAWQAKKATDDDGRQVVAVGTRMRNETLLQRALTDTGATVTTSGDVLTASWGGTTQGRFTKDASGIWSVHLVGDTDFRQASDLISRVDAHYGRHVQAEVLARLREHAPAAGMEIESETVEEDDTVTMVLAVNAGSLT